MNRTALLLSCVALGWSLAVAPAAAATPASAAVKATVTQVKTGPAKTAGKCPTTVGFSAVVTARGRGTVRYRWVRSDGSKGVVQSVRVKGTRMVTVRDRQTFDRDTSGWQAVEIIGKKGLSGKAPFNVTCEGPIQVWDLAHPLPPAPGKPLVATAHVDVTPPVHTGPCPTTVKFTATIQVSYVPATVNYRWIDSVTGEGRTESLVFAVGGPRVKQFALPMGVGSTTSGWKAIRILDPGGQDSGRAVYQVTCGTGPSPSPTPTTPPWLVPQVHITSLVPKDYEGPCAYFIDYQAEGSIELPAGAAQTVTYWWTLDGQKWDNYLIAFPASTSARRQTVSLTWKLKPNGSDSLPLSLTAAGGGTPSTQTFTITCVDDPQ
ncbi:hypothetical protein GT755_28985 [Herbidospora sp. NEAU-GS84]|uniref:Ig-like domain-containing protein n=1 Tax=Herbidospora solisilvae TaxID=2696284 RepID=A0A7C9J691_9ACTN|nr:hypothetical protein [Herbidospora solisilvae]NAS25706.1 hypothetical protein [Herbidospora solisilvae]